MGGVREQRGRRKGVKCVRQAGVAQLRRGQLWNNVQHVGREIPGEGGSVLRGETVFPFNTTRNSPNQRTAAAS